MKKIDLIKKANAGDSVINNKGIQENREKMGLSNEQQKVVGKNINLSLPVKNKDNTVPFNVQLNTARKNVEAEPSITEAKMDKKEVDFNSKDKKQVMDINVESQKLDNKKNDAFKKSEAAAKKDTEFWDKYVGVQLEEEGMPTKVKVKVPDSSSQLPNNPERFKGEKVDKMVMASIKDADAMLFHIYATAKKEARSLTAEEEQQVVDIESGKMRVYADLTAQPMKPVKKDHQGPIIQEIGIDVGGGAMVMERDGTKIDKFKSCEDAKANYPEGDVQR